MSKVRAERYAQAADRLRAMTKECADWCETDRPSELSLIYGMTAADADRYVTMLAKMRAFTDRLDQRSRMEANSTLKEIY